jgi:hypothetical protein
MDALSLLKCGAIWQEAVASWVLWVEARWRVERSMCDVRLCGATLSRRCLVGRIGRFRAALCAVRLQSTLDRVSRLHGKHKVARAYPGVPGQTKRYIFLPLSAKASSLPATGLLGKVAGCIIPMRLRLGG